MKLDFTLAAPSSVSRKQIVDLETLRYRVTITQAGQADPTSVSKTVQVDVLDFP